MSINVNTNIISKTYNYHSYEINNQKYVENVIYNKNKDDNKNWINKNYLFVLIVVCIIVIIIIVCYVVFKKYFRNKYYYSRYESNEADIKTIELDDEERDVNDKTSKNYIV